MAFPTVFSQRRILKEVKAHSLYRGRGCWQQRGTYQPAHSTHELSGHRGFRASCTGHRRIRCETINLGDTQHRGAFLKRSHTSTKILFNSLYIGKRETISKIFHARQRFVHSSCAELAGRYRLLHLRRHELSELGKNVHVRRACLGNSMACKGFTLTHAKESWLAQLKGAQLRSSMITLNACSERPSDYRIFNITPFSNVNQKIVLVIELHILYYSFVHWTTLLVSIQQRMLFLEVNSKKHSEIDLQRNLLLNHEGV